MSVPKTCLSCRILIGKGNRCQQHQREYERLRSPLRKAYSDPLYRSYVKASSCARCGATDDLTKDHIQGLKDGGTNDHRNLRTLCRRCNSEKH